MKGEGQAVLDIIPVDVVVNLLITSAWHKGMNKKNNIDIYHCTTGGLHPFRWSEMGNYSLDKRIYLLFLLNKVSKN
jgi:alcohol-forming fatty acyl-CoA reductase